MATQLQIINRALTNLGASTISATSDGSPEGVTSAAQWPAVVEDLASRHRWRFLSEQVDLTRDATAPEARYDARYAVPADCVQIIAVTVNDQPIEFDRYGGYILCDAGENDIVTLDYVSTARQSDPEYWPGYFQTLVEWELTARMAIPIGDRADLADFYQKKADRHYGLCKNMDSQARTTKRIRGGSLVSVRYR